MTQRKMYQAHYSTATDSRVVQTRQALRQALLTLLKSKPLEQITIREVAATAGVGYNTFFRHHTSKEELLNDVAADEIKQLLELSVTTLDAADTKAASLALCQYVADRDALWSTLLTGGAANTLRNEFIHRSLEVAAAQKKRSDLIPSDLGAKMVASGTLELLAWWLEQKERIPIEKLAAIYDQVVVTPTMEAYL